MVFLTGRTACWYAALLLSGLISCTRTTIEFGTVPENNYTKLVYIDTVGVRMSTVMIDSFESGGATSFLLGRYYDPYLGVVTARPFFQLDKPATIPEIASNAIYDSLLFQVKLNDYYYGDTSRSQTIIVNELAEPITMGYNNKLYSSRHIPAKATPLGIRTLSFKPITDDSILIRLSDVKGAELFDRLKQSSDEMTNSESFLNYLKGISLTIADGDTTAVIGLSGTTDMHMRIYYHTNTPFDESYYIDFPVLANGYAFNQVTSYRPNTGLVPGGTGLTEIPSSLTNKLSFSQPGTGLNLKITFPTLKDVFIDETYSKLLKAELVVRPANQSFDRNKYRLPPQLQLIHTDATGVFGAFLTDSSGLNILYATPVIDDIYGRNNYYKFNITNFISDVLQTPGNGRGLYLYPEFSNTSPQISRLILETSAHSDFITQLQLSVLVVNK